MNPPFHADHVGSLTRPAEVLEAREAHAAGRTSGDDLRAVEDAAILAAIAMQERVGLQSTTDGELRRSNWRDRFFESVEGFSERRVPSSFTFTEFSGEKRPGMPVPVVVGKLSRRTRITADDFAFLQAHTQGTAKATIPSPTVNHFFSGDRSLQGSPYEGDRKAFLSDVVGIYKEEMADLAAAGCRYLQIDEVPLAVLCDPKNQEIVRERGEDPRGLIRDYVQAIDEMARGRPAGMVVCVHLCRGNAGHGQASGGYDLIAEQLFNDIAADGYFLEYDTERAGGFEPLRFVPKHKVVALGLISTKIQELEPADDVKRRLDEASRYVDLERLCLCPQCGFASSVLTQRFPAEHQERKLAHLVDIARQVWG